MGTKRPSVVKLTPDGQLVFEVNGQGGAEAILQIQNTGDTPVMFKVKTTAPDKYIVKPNSGLLKARGQTAVKMSLRPDQKRLAQKEEECKDKFLVQTLLETDVNDPEIWKVDTVWKATEKMKHLYMLNKIRCVWKFPGTDGSGVDNNSSDGASASSPADMPPPYQTSADRVTPQQAQAQTEAPNQSKGTSESTPTKSSSSSSSSKAASESEPSSGLTRRARGARAAAAGGADKPSSSSSSASTATEIKKKDDAARIYLIVAAFIIGIIFGKLVV